MNTRICLRNNESKLPKKNIFVFYKRINRYALKVISKVMTERRHLALLHLCFYTGDHPE